jgi:pimeloyl-ACP methyl ester carboxylesterase
MLYTDRKRKRKNHATIKLSMTKIRSLVIAIFTSCIFFCFNSTSAQTPCGNILTVWDGVEVAIPIEDCDDPFAVETVNEFPRAYIASEEVIEDLEIVASDEPQPVRLEGIPDMDRYAVLYRKEGENYRVQAEFYDANASYVFTVPGTYVLYLEEHEPISVIGSSVWETVHSLFVHEAYAYYFTSRTVTFQVVAAEDEKRVSNILFIPGIQASRLYTKDTQGAEKRLWEPFGDSDIGQLAMTPTGEGIVDVYTKDIIEEKLGVTIGGNVYKSFLEFLDTTSTHASGTIYRSFPYDWRYSVLDIVEDGTRYDDGLMKGLVETIAYLSTLSPTDKTTIIAHSNGGLLAKALMQKLVETGDENRIDKIIFIAVPHIGTPKGLLALLHGYDQRLPLGIFGEDEVIRSAMQNMPGVYGLLPSDAYVSSLEEPLISFDESTTTKLYRDKYGFTVTGSEYRDFLTGKEGRMVDMLHVHEIAKANEVLLEDALNTHQNILDSWEAPKDVAVYNIVGTGLRTPKSVVYETFDAAGTCLGGVCDIAPIIEPVIQFTNYGDETVVTRSALSVSTSSLFVNFKEINGESILELDFNHTNLLEAQNVQLLIDYILHGSSTEDIPFVSTAVPNFDMNTTIMTIHSPARMYAMDTYGRMTGKVDEHSKWKIEIPDSAYFEVGDVKYLLIPSTAKYTMTITGQAPGFFTHRIQELVGTTDGTLQLSQFRATSTTGGTYSYSYDGERYSDVSIDQNGDGYPEKKMSIHGASSTVTVTYHTLREVIQKLPIKKSSKQHLLRLVDMSEHLHKKHKKHKRFEYVGLSFLKMKVELYVRLHVLTHEQGRQLQILISNLAIK